MRISDVTTFSTHGPLRTHTVLAPDALTYNPCNDLIFPSVVRAGDHLRDPLARYYMYYAPHDAPGGISLAVADALEGPWREYQSNPLVRCQWSPHYAVDHVSSPHALWRPDRRELWLYYHGDNDTTRWAVSSDGVRFDYGGEAVRAAAFGMDGASYARVFPSPFSAGRGRYVMLLLLYEYVDGSWTDFKQFGIYGAWSDDGMSWELVERPILDHTDASGFVCSPFLSLCGDRVIMLFHMDHDGSLHPTTDVHAVEIDNALAAVGSPILICDRRVFGSTNERVSDPCLVVEDPHRYLFLSVGSRLNQRLGLVTMHPSVASGSRAG